MGLREGKTTMSLVIETNTVTELDGVLELRSMIAGEVMLPGDEGYDDARQIWNGMIDKYPAFIVRPLGVSDVQCAVRYAVEHTLSVSIKGGGHNVAGHAVGEQSLMIDFSAMKAVRVNPATQTAWVQGGALWEDFDRETSVFGLATTGGVIGSTGVAGLTLGGGIGWLVGKHGMSIDNLISLELVTADGECITASAESHPDLFWALRGGGGNFGVVTGFEFGLHPVTDVLAGMLIYPAEEAKAVLEFYREYTMSTPDALTVYAQFNTDPASGARIIAIAVCWSGPMEDGEAVIAPARNFGTPWLDAISVMPYRQWQAMFDAEFPHGRRYYWKGNLYDQLSDELLDTVVEFGTNPQLASCIATFECYRGKMNRIEPDATAFAHRDARYQLVIIGGWDDPADDAVGKSWVRDFAAATEPMALNGTFLNFNALEQRDRSQRVQAGFGPNWDRLVAIKRRYDPTNLFRENNNIAI